MEPNTVEKAVSVMQSVRWDTPYRVAASALGIAAVLSIWTHTTPLLVLAAFISWFARKGPAEWLRTADSWAVAHASSDVVVLPLSIAVALAVLVTWWKGDVLCQNRGPATFWVAVAAVSYTPHPVALAVWSTVLALLVALVICKTADTVTARWREWVGMTAMNIAGGGLWVLVVVLAGLYGATRIRSAS